MKKSKNVLCPKQNEKLQTEHHKEEDYSLADFL